MKILIAEDEVISRRILEKTLAEWGYEVVSTTNGTDAWQALQACDAPRLAILDWIMPGMDGIDIIRRVRSIRSPDPPYLIILTFMEGSRNIVNALEAGANDYVSKPFDHEELKARIRVGERMLELQHKLMSYNEDLEKEVAARTADLWEAKDAAEAGNRAKTAFIANMSHEVRTPLNAIIGFSEVLIDGLAGELNVKQKEYSGEILEAGRRILQLFLNVLDFAKIESGDMRLRNSNFMLRQLLVSSMQTVEEEARRRGIPLTLDMAMDADIRICADSDKLGRTLSCLLDNAVKFTPDGGGGVRISAKPVRYGGETASCRLPSGEPFPAGNASGAWNLLEISVADNGIGIKREDIGRLFTPFTQLDEPDTKRFKGAGLGLALAKKLVELHGGCICAKSEFGSGSTFTFVIPVGLESCDAWRGGRKGRV
ncbi:MAG: response regulator [Nitrospirae bacterium]|nr:response regulator [Nitrospirota bacterium]